MQDSELGKKSQYEQTYNPDILYPISRIEKRQELGIDPDAIPFFGFDCWNHYEVSWLNAKGKPMVAIAEIMYDCDSPFIIESKSLKLYFNSFNHSNFNNISQITQIITQDLSAILQTKVSVAIFPIDANSPTTIQPCFSGESLDDLDVACTTYTVDSSYLMTNDDLVTEELVSDLLKSNCLVTHQPDWGSVQIAYHGKQINREGLLKYIVSFRNHNEFHEQCIERIFMDIMQQCSPIELTVYGRYTRRGGLDINPYRSTQKTTFSDQNIRLLRQ